jgi:PEP-CTERM motif
MFLSRALNNLHLTGNSRYCCLHRTLTAACLVVVALFANSIVQAATINYGNFNVPPAGIMFLQVTESSVTDPVPLFGPPSPFVTGLDFDPITFASSSANGAADITDGQLNFTIMGLSNPNGYVGITGINLSEAGDYTLAGAGGPPTSVFAGAIIRATITEVNGVPVAPINVPPVNASFGDSLPGQVVVAPWSLGLFQNIDAALGQGQLATKVEVVINNTLVSTSEPNPSTVAFIAKKEFVIRLIPETVGDPFIPEPSTLVLLAVAGSGLLAVRRRDW